jgi:hyperosmotically inducible protein
VAGETIDDARIDTVIKAKYILDRDVSAVDISVDVSDGRVVLSGRVGSPAIIGRAMELALDTDGVKSVSSDLTIRPLN